MSNTTNGGHQSDNAAYKYDKKDIYIELIIVIQLYSWLCESCLVMEVILEHGGLDLSQDGLQLTNMQKARSSLEARELRKVATRELG